MTHSFTQTKLEEAEYKNAFLAIVKPLFRTTIVSSVIEWDLLIAAQNKFYLNKDKISLDQVKVMMTDLKLASQTKHLETAKTLLKQYINGDITFEMMAEKLKSFAPKQKSSEEALLALTKSNEEKWTALVYKETLHLQCFTLLSERKDLEAVSVFFGKLQQHWINSIPTTSTNLLRDFEKSKKSFNKLFNIINQVVRLFVMAKGDDMHNTNFDGMIQALGPLALYLGEKAKNDPQRISKMLNSATELCEKIVANINKINFDIKQRMADAAAPKSSQKEIYKKAVFYIEQWLAIQYSRIKPTFMQKNTLQQMQEYIALRKSTDQDWENIYHNLRAQFVIPKLLKDFAKNQTLPTLPQETKSTEAKLPTFEESKTSHVEKADARHLFYVELGEAFNTKQIAALPDRLLQSLPTLIAMRLRAAVAADMQETRTTYQTLEDPISDQDFIRTQQVINEHIDIEPPTRRKSTR